MGLNWQYQDKDFTENDIKDYLGFVYVITNLSNGMQYIGKKLFYSSRMKKLKGQRKKRYKTISDWQTYYGSNDKLVEDVLSLGPDKFNRSIIHLCKTKGECNYLEAKEQFTHSVLENDAYYNSWIMVKVHKSHIKNYAEKVRNNRSD